MTNRKPELPNSRTGLSDFEVQKYLKLGPASVTEVSARFGKSKALVNIHLRNMMKRGLVDRYKSGSAYYYFNENLLEAMS